MHFLHDTSTMVDICDPQQAYDCVFTFAFYLMSKYNGPTSIMDVGDVSNTTSKKTGRFEIQVHGK